MQILYNYSGSDRIRDPQHCSTCLSLFFYRELPTLPVVSSSYTNCYLSTCLTVSAPGRVENDQDVFLLFEERLERLLREVNHSRLSGVKGS
jgi:hypothetical protein